MAGGVRERSVLAPAGHPPVDEARVPGEADVRSDAEPFGNTSPEPLEQRVGPLRQAQHDLDAFRHLEVDGNRAASSLDHRPGQRRRTRVLRAVDPDHLRAHVGQEHPRERPRPDAL